MYTVIIYIIDVRSVGLIKMSSLRIIEYKLIVYIGMSAMEQQQLDDEAIKQYRAQYLSPISVTTATVAYDSNLCIGYEDMSRYVKADGVTILAVKSTCLDLQECLDGGKYTKAINIMKKRKRDAQKRSNIHSRPCRTLTGNQLYFQSAVELVKTFGDKYHNIRISPARGSIQIQGVKEPIFETAEMQINGALDYIKQKMSIDTEFKLRNRRIIIINIKTKIVHPSTNDNTFLRIDKLSEIIQNLIRLQTANEPLPIEIPYKIIYVTDPYEAGSYTRIKFITPIPDNIHRKTTIKIFTGKKINFLGCPTIECPYYIYKFLDEFIDYYKEHILWDKPVVSNTIFDLGKYINDLHHNEYAFAQLIRQDISSDDEED